MKELMGWPGFACPYYPDLAIFNYFGTFIMLQPRNSNNLLLLSSPEHLFSAILDRRTARLCHTRSTQDYAMFCIQGFEVAAH